MLAAASLRSLSMDCAAPKLSPPELAARMGEQEIPWQEKNVFYRQNRQRDPYSLSLGPDVSDCRPSDLGPVAYTSVACHR